MYSNVLENARGVVFMGTPHRGSDLAWWSSFLANILQVTTAGTSTNPRLVTALKNESTTLSDISTQFIERGAGLKIYTFYETERFERMNCLVCHVSYVLTNADNGH
jgi:hypothetical protein